MKIHTLYNRTPHNRKLLGQYIRLLKIKKGHLDNGNGYLAAQTQSTHRWHGDQLKPVPLAKRTTYISTIEFKDRLLNVTVSCSCADFKYRSEAALHHKWKAAKIEYSNGDLPVIRNPTLAPYMCRHLVGLYLRFADQIPRT